jgi:sRNA-binding protein
MPQDVNSLLDRLCEAFPACFSRSALKSLKIGLGEELLALAGVHPALADLSRTQIRRAIKVYTGAPAYRKALARGGPRYGLDGQPTGAVTPEQQIIARTPRPKLPASPASPPAPEPQAPDSPATPATGYLPMTLKRRL